MKSSKSALAVAAALVLGLALGSWTSATAAGLTKSKVKAIAAKVVKKQAPTLSVAHAATADTAASAASATNADKVGGVTAAALKTSAYTYTLPVQAPAGIRTYSFPGLAAGNYLVSYNLESAVADVSSYVICWMKTAGASVPNYARNYGQNIGGGTFSRISATQLIPATPTTTLNCNGNGGTGAGGVLALTAGEPHTITFLPIDILVTTGSTATRPAAGSDLANR
jgi:hypothetical protein